MTDIVERLKGAGATLLPSGAVLCRVAGSNTASLRRAVAEWLPTPEGARWAAGQAEARDALAARRAADVGRFAAPDAAALEAQWAALPPRLEAP